MFAYLFVIVAGIWRFIDGGSRETFGIPTGLRNVGTALLALGASLYAMNFDWALLVTLDPKALTLTLYSDWRYAWALLPASMATASIIIGWTNWANAPWQFVRFALPAAIAIGPMFYYDVVNAWAFGYVVACGLAGASYTLLMKFDSKLPRWFVIDGFENGPHLLFDGFEAYARIPLGGAVVGGLAFLPYIVGTH